MADTYLFKRRAVAFLDVLGFRQKLEEFEVEAKSNRIQVNGLDPTAEHYISEMANDFINTFNTAIARLDQNKYRHYLFSDNICITSIQDTTTADLQDLFLVITDLYFEFAKKGYFLRGGIDYGLFIDGKEIAVGRPLAKAYELESKSAVYPRIILSPDIVKEFQEFDNAGRPVFEYAFSGQLIRESCEIKYINIFLQVFRTDYREDREAFFIVFKEILEHNLNLNKNRENIYVKYKWLADQFNLFIDEFTTTLAYLDNNFDPEEDGFLDLVKQQKISYEN